MYARGAVGKVAPHCAVVFNWCLTTRLGADVRTPGTRQRQEAEAEAGGRGRRQEAGGRGRRQRQEAEAEAGNRISFRKY